MSALVALQSALIAGAIAAAKPTASAAISDAYQGLKTVLSDTYDGLKGSLSFLDSAPEDERAVSAVSEDLEKSDAAKNDAVQDAVAALRAILDAEAPEALQSVEVRLKNLSAGKDIEVSGGQVRVEGEDWRAGGDATFTAFKKN